jgi:hypothetical protein
VQTGPGRDRDQAPGWPPTRKESTMRNLAVAALALSLAACGSESNPPTGSSSPPPPAAPGANITATGGGSLVVHPSINLIYLVALETPIRIMESAGGSADWNFARMSLFMNGVELERSEMGSDALQAAGFGRISGNSNQVYRTIFRFNADDFDRIDITLGFTDRKDGRTFTVVVPLESFPDVNLSFNPLALPRSALPL